MLAGLKPALYNDSARKTYPVNKAIQETEIDKRSFFDNSRTVQTRSSMALQHEKLPNLYDPSSLRSQV